MINRRRFLIGSVLPILALTVGVSQKQPPIHLIYYDDNCVLTDLEIENSDVIRALFHYFKGQNRVIHDECRMAWRLDHDPVPLHVWAELLEQELERMPAISRVHAIAEPPQGADLDTQRV